MNMEKYKRSKTYHCILSHKLLLNLLENKKWSTQILLSINVIN